VDVKAVGEAAAGIAHELNNRLSVILGQAQLLRRSAGADATVDRKLQTIEREVQRASAMTRGLLERARTEPRQEPVAVNTVVACALDAVEPRLSELAIAVETDLSDEQPVVLGDLERLIQVLLHLVNNAVDAMGESGTLTVTTELTDDAVTLAVADTGAGMEAEQATRIFEPFYTTKANGRGAGLGLFLTLGILKTHGGSISVESTPGHGTTMRVRLPRSDAPTLGVIR
jgi:signal transduction histidine kinase